MAKIQQSLSWWCVKGKGVGDRELLEGAASIGFDGVEMLGRDLWPVARDLGLELTTHVGHRSIEEGCNNPAHHDRIEAELLENIALAAEWGIPKLICFSGNRNGLSDEKGQAHCVEFLRRIVPQAEKAGVLLVMELLNSKVDHLDYQCDQTVWGVELCRQVDSPGLKLLYDIYHLQIMEGDIIRTIQQYHAWLGHYHTAGCPGRKLMDRNQELYYPPIYRAIAATGYQGAIGHEFLPTGDPLKELSWAFNECRDNL